MSAEALVDYEGLDDLALARCIAARDPQAVRLFTQRHNQRLYRTAWSILKNRTEAEDAVQSAYLNALAAIENFEGRSSLSTWLTRITINEALGRARSAERRRTALDASSVTVLDDYRDKLMRGSMNDSAPDANIARAQIRRVLDEAIARLPDPFRVVFVLREVEELSVEETAAVLAISPVTVRTRHFRARQRLQEQLSDEFRGTIAGVFPFAGSDCVEMTSRVSEVYLTAGHA